MQRFKSHLFDVTPTTEMMKWCVGIQRPASWPSYADREGKFVYGASGTLTQAARCRIQAIRALRGARTGFELTHETPFRYLADYTRESVRRLLTSSRQGGCRLP